MKLILLALVQSITIDGSRVLQDQRIDADTLQPAPDAVITAPSPGLEAGWTWAATTARERAFDAYWIGWSIAGDTSGGTWHYTDRWIPLDAGGGTSSRMHLTSVSWFSGAMSFSGARPGALVGSTDPHELIVLVRYERQAGNPTVTRVHVGNAVFPLRFGRGTLLWLGRANDASSVTRLRALSTGHEAFLSSLVGFVGVHRSAEVAAPVLRDWLLSADSTAVRREAASWLGHHAHATAIDALERALRDDSSTSVRSTATRSLARVAPVASAIATLTRVAREDAAQSVRRSAIQAIGAIRDARAVTALAGLIEDPGDVVPAATRRDAVGVFGRQARGPTPRATVELLQRVSRSDADASVRLQAAESLMSLSDVATVPFLVALVDHPDARVQQRAVQALGRAEPRAEAIEALRRLAWEHARAETQRNATRALAQPRTEEARRVLADIAERHPNAEVRRAALQTIVQIERSSPPPSG